MSGADARSTHLPDDAATRRLGQLLAAELRPGDVVALLGPLGAGKTTLVQAVAAELGVIGPVRSPTFALRHDHVGRIPLVHIDLYRLDQLRDALVLDVDEVAADGAVLFIEWADRFPDILPGHTLVIRLEPERAGRRVTLWDGDGDGAWLDALLRPWGASERADPPLALRSA